MTIQVLVSTMHQTDHSLLDKMNIQTDAIVVNQCDENKIEELSYCGHHVLWLSLKERGVGLSRNTALMRADADILLFADDDIVYCDGYAEKVLNAFQSHPETQLIVFNFESQNPERPEYIVAQEQRLCWYNCLKYGACRIAIRKDAIRKANIFFSLLFGGGAVYQAGEDNLFISNCLQAGIKGVASTELLGTVKQETSTWFKGYDKKYYIDRGALFAAMYGKKGLVCLVLFELKNCRRKRTFSLIERYKLERLGFYRFLN